MLIIDKPLSSKRGLISAEVVILNQYFKRETLSNGKGYSAKVAINCNVCGGCW